MPVVRLIPVTTTTHLRSAVRMRRKCGVSEGWLGGALWALGFLFPSTHSAAINEESQTRGQGQRLLLDK